MPEVTSAELARQDADLLIERQGTLYDDSVLTPHHAFSALEPQLFPFERLVTNRDQQAATQVLQNLKGPFVLHCGTSLRALTS